MRVPFFDFADKFAGRIGRNTSIVLICTALVITILAVYIQTGNHQFLNLDDNAYVTDNPHIAGGMTGENIVRAFTAVDRSNWHPLTWLSHLADVQLYGMNPRGHHLTSVAIHTLSALILFILLVRLTDRLWQSLFVAALFALHPLHVESVAWIAERKDVLSAFFWFLTLLAYSEYAAKQKPVLYILALLSFVLGLMSKPMLVTLPLIMLLLDFWPLDRYRLEAGQGAHTSFSRIATLIKEKIPFFICSVLSCFITIYAQHKGGAIAGLAAVPFQLRCENALTAYLKYLGKTIWPVDLAIYYPISLSIPLWQVIGSFSILLMISVAAIRSRSGHPYFAVGWFWFMVTLVPVIGLIQVGGQSMADRYSYIPLTGLFIIAAWGVPTLAGNIPYRHVILALLTGIVIITSTALTWKQLGYWRNNISLYQHTLEITTGNYLIHNNLGIALQNEGQLDAAIREYQKALRIFPNYPNAHYNLGMVFQNKGYLDAAISEYRMALWLTPYDVDAHINLGLVFQTRSELDAAIYEYNEALRIDPNHQNARFNLEQALTQKNRLLNQKTRTKP